MHVKHFLSRIWEFGRGVCAKGRRSDRNELVTAADLYGGLGGSVAGAHAWMFAVALVTRLFLRDAFWEAAGIPEHLLAAVVAWPGLFIASPQRARRARRIQELC